MVARDAEFGRALGALDDSAESRGVVMVGESGVGKSTLANALAETLESSGRTVRFALGTQTGSAVPLGAFSRAVTVDAAHELVAMLATAQKTLAREENLVLVVDDAQLLDPLSATLVHQLAAAGSARLIVTIRSGETAPDAVTALLKERLLMGVHIDPFTREQTAELARGVLGDTVEARLIDELYRRTAGNLLLLRGLLGAGQESGVLVHTENGWHLRGPLHPDRELSDLLEFRLRSLAPEELQAVQVLAVGELLDWELLRGVCDADAVARLEQRGLIQLVADRSDLVARLNHPIIGEAAIRLAGMVRTRQINSLLAQALQKHLQAGGGRSRLPDVRGRIRLAQFITHSDLVPDLGAIIRAAKSAVIMSNLACGEELARFALDRGGGLRAAIIVAEALSWQGRGDEAEAVLGAFAPGGADESLRVRWGCLRAANLFWGCGRVDDAREALAAVRDHGDSDTVGRLVAAMEVSFAFFSGDLATAIETGLALCESNADPPGAMWTTMAMSTSWALALAGRFGDVHRAAEVGLRAAALGKSGTHGLATGLAEVTALTAAGDLSGAERLWEPYAAMGIGVPEADAIVGVVRGHLHLARGELSEACAAFEDAVSAMSQGFPPGWLMLAAAWSAQAEGARGNAGAALASLHRSEEAYGPHVAVFLPELELAKAWERASGGETTTARMHAMRAAQIARRSGMCTVEMRALHTAVRFGDRSLHERLGELAKALNTPMADAIAAHALGLTNHDGDLLDTAADRFAAIEALALAADAAAQAAHEHFRSGYRSKALESSAHAHWLAGRSGARTPAINAAARPLPITDREREIAMLVATGLSNRQIADRLSVSVRTVDGHLYRIFAKLGIEHRDQLSRLLGEVRSRV